MHFRALLLIKNAVEHVKPFRLKDRDSFIALLPNVDWFIWLFHAAHS